MFTLNLLFDFDRSNGRFSGDRNGTPSALFKSNNWLLLQESEPANPAPPAFDPERDIWQDKGEASTPRLVEDHSNPNQNICIRIAPDPDSPAIDLRTTTLTLVAAFGAKLPAAPQAHASPFTLDDTKDGPIMTTVVSYNIPANTSAGWFVPLGRIRKVPGANDRHRFQFAVGIIVTSGGQSRTFGEDPDMDVGP